MKKIFLIIFIVILAVGTLLYLRQRKETAPPLAPNATIVAFGDSLVYGTGATPGHDFVSLLSSESARPILNLGVPGNTTADGLARIASVLEKKPGIVILLFGGNDALRQIPPEETESNLSAIISGLQSNGAAVILLGVQGGLFGDPYEDMFERIAKNYDTLYVPNVMKGLIGRKEYMSDAVHPNDLGYAKIAEKVRPKLEQVLR